VIYFYREIMAFGWLREYCGKGRFPMVLVRNLTRGYGVDGISFVGSHPWVRESLWTGQVE